VTQYLHPGRDLNVGRLPTGCVDTAGCPVTVDVRINRHPNASKGASVSWVLRALSFAAGAAAAPPFRFGAASSEAVSFEDPALVASATGRATISAKDGLRLPTNAVFNLQDVPQGGPPLVGTLQAVLTVTTPSVAGSRPDAVRLNVDNSFGTIGPTGRELRGFGELRDVACDGRSLCPVELDAGVGLDPQFTGTLEVEWKLEVRYVTSFGLPVPAEATLGLQIATPAPS
jgi:hypothetical protein